MCAVASWWMIYFFFAPPHAAQIGAQFSELHRFVHEHVSACLRLAHTFGSGVAGNNNRRDIDAGRASQAFDSLHSSLVVAQAIIGDNGIGGRVVL